GLDGGGEKRYLVITGFKGCFRGTVSLMITKQPRGWQWTGIALHSPTKFWLDRWKPKVIETNDPLPFNDLRAPWPRPLCFTAGGILEYSFLDSLVVAGGLFGLVFASMMAARDCCGFGPRGFYYNELISHNGSEAFAIDFTRYKRYVPYHAETKGTPVLAARGGKVLRSMGKYQTGSFKKNFVEIVHPDLEDPATDRFMTRYLHLDGPGSVKVSNGMHVTTGTLLGFMDDTGNSANNHLHFSIHDFRLGKSVRPTPMSGQTLEDGDSNKCIKSDNIDFRGTNTMITPSHYTSQNWLIVPAATPANEAAPASIADQQWTLTLSGLAIINLKGAGPNWFRETALLQPDVSAPVLYAIGKHKFPVPANNGFVPYFEVNQYVLHGALSTMFNDDNAVNAGFSVDNWQMHPSLSAVDAFTNAQMRSLFNGIEVDIAVSDSDGFIYGLSYHITLLGKIRMGTLLKS
ncbi:MAG TPA: M23 family metallopeptidase, partial [Chitinophagaceae bacterium]